MNILIPIGSFYPDQSGGPSNTMYWHSWALTEANVNCTIVTTGMGIPTSDLDHWKETHFGKIIYCSNRLHLLPLRMLFTSFKCLKSADIVHLTSVFYFPSLLVALVNILFYGKPLVWSVRGEFEAGALVFRSQVKQVYLRIVRRLSRKCIWHATSEAEVASISNILGLNQQIILLPNYIYLDSKPVQATEEKYLLYLGRIHPIKALDNLIKGLQLSKHFRNSGYTLRIVGRQDNDHSAYLKDLCKENGLSNHISFVEHTDGTAKEQLLGNAYFLLLPSHSENFGNVVVEALAQGTPVLASQNTPWQILETHNAGIWCPNTPQALADQIDFLLTIPAETYKIMRYNAKNLCDSTFDAKANIHKWIEVYAQITNSTTFKH